MMLKQKEIISGKLRQLSKMQGYLDYSSKRMCEQAVADKHLRSLSNANDGTSALSYCTELPMQTFYSLSLFQEKLSQLRTLALALVAALMLTLPTTASSAVYGANQCAATRFGSNLGCTANDVSINSIEVVGTSVGSCVGGVAIPLDLKVTVNFGNATRYDIGVFLANDAKSPQLTIANGGSSSCSVSVLPTSSPFYGSVASGGDGDACGDGGDSLSGSFTMSGVNVTCLTDGSGTSSLYIPYVISWDQLSSNTCNNNTNPVPGTTSKCNGGTVVFPPGSSIVVLPKVTINDGITTIISGGSVTYTIVVDNTTGSTLTNAVFSDPAVTDLSISNVSCTSANGATCPSSLTVSNLQSGITLPNVPAGGVLTFTVVGTYTGTPVSPTTLTNTANITISGQTNSSSDTDIVMIAPTATKSFSPSAIAPNGTSTMTVTLTNPNSINITGATFTDNYPSNMQNTTPSGSSTTCTGGTVTATAGGETLTLTGATIPANSSCTISVNVWATASGVNSIGTITTTNAGSRTTAASGTLQVVSASNSTVVASPTSVPNDGSSTSTITVTLKDTAGNPVAGKTITLTAGSGSSTITTLIGTTNASGQATFTVKDTVQEAVTYTAKDTTDNLTITQTATVTFSSVNSFNAFESSTAAAAITGSIYTKLAGTAFSLDVVAISAGSKATGFNNNVKIELLANTGTAGSGYGADNCPTSSSVIQTIASTAIASGRSSVSFSAVASAYKDVRVRISYPTTSPTIIICSTDSFAIRPTATSISTSAIAIGPSALALPAIKTGASFDLRATTTTGTNYAGVLTLDTSKLSAQTPSQDTTLQSGGTIGTLTPSSLTANAALVNATYTEVGYLYLAAGAYRDDTYTTVDIAAGDCVSTTSGDAYLSDTLNSEKYGCSIGNKTSISLGRFIPDHFVLTSSSTFEAGCSDGFSYMGEPFRVEFNVEARNASNGKTTNYTGAFGSGLVSIQAENANSGSSLLSRLTTISGSWSSGIYAVSDSAVTFSRPSTAVPDATWGSYESLALGVSVTDEASLAANLRPYIWARDMDVATSTVCTVDTVNMSNGTCTAKTLGTTKQRFGRIRLLNAYGSELLPVHVPVRAEYFNGTLWVLNTSDTCTAIPTTAVALGDRTPSTLGSSATSITQSSGGVWDMVLSIPNSAGGIDVGLNLGTGTTAATNCLSSWTNGPNATTAAPLSYLLGNWCGTSYDKSPIARIKFGSPKAPYIYLRERY